MKEIVFKNVQSQKFSIYLNGIKFKICLINFPVNVHDRKNIPLFYAVNKNLGPFKINFDGRHPDLISAYYMGVFIRPDPINE